MTYAGFIFDALASLAGVVAILLAVKAYKVSVRAYEVSGQSYEVAKGQTRKAFELSTLHELAMNLHTIAENAVNDGDDLGAIVNRLRVNPAVMHRIFSLARGTLPSWREFLDAENLSDVVRFVVVESERRGVGSDEVREGKGTDAQLAAVLFTVLSVDVQRAIDSRTAD